MRLKVFSIIPQSRDFVTLNLIILYIFLTCVKVFSFSIPNPSLRITSLLITNTIELLLFFLIYVSVRKQRIWLLNFNFIFILFFYLYNFTFYFYYQLIKSSVIEDYTDVIFSVSDISKSLVFISIIFSLLTASFIILSVVFRNNNDYKMKLQLVNKIEELKTRKFNILNLSIIAILFNLYAFGYDLSFVAKGGIALVNSINDRATLLAELNDPRYMWFIKYIYTAYTCSIIFILWVRYKKLDLQSKALLFLINLPVIFFWIIFFFIGNRREFVYVFLFVLSLFLLKKDVKTMKFAFWGFLAMILFLIIGLFRTGHNFHSGLKYFLTNGLGDFIIPHNTFVYYYTQGVDRYFGGLTYFAFIFLFIPRFLWASKPISLAVQFVNNLGLPMGFGFSPVAEAYMNFGNFSLVLFPLSIILLISVVYKLNKSAPFLYLFLFIQILNLNRGEMSAVISEIIIMYIIFNIIYKLCFKYGSEES